MPSKIQLVAPEVRQHTMAGPAVKALMVTTPIPETDACAAAVADLERAVDDYVEAVGRLKEVDDVERDYARKVDAEAQAAVAEGRAPKAIKKPDFDDARQKCSALVKARLGVVHTARAALDKQVEADREEQGKRDAARVPELYEQVMASLAGLRSSFESLLEARDNSIAQLGGNPNYVVRNLPWHGPVNDGLDAVQKWLTDAGSAITEPTIDVRGVEPSMEIRRQMYNAGDMDGLYNIEFAENFAITSYTRGHTPPLMGANNAAAYLY